MTTRERKYTPGPWKFVKGKFNGGAGSSVSGIGSIRCGSEGFYICEIEDADEHEANANLIKASPDLFEALEPFANFACDEWETHGCFNCIAKRAIAKATGVKP